MNFQPFIKNKNKNKKTNTHKKDPTEDVVKWLARTGDAGFKERRRPFTDCKEGVTSLVSMLISSPAFNIQIRSVGGPPERRSRDGWLSALQH